MNDWTDDELDAVGSNDELEITSYKEDGSHRRWVTIWAVRFGDELYVRSARGREGGWFRHALASGTGRIRTRGAERDVTFVGPDRSVGAELDGAYLDKYRRYGERIYGPVVGEHSYDATLRLDARGA